MEVISLSLFYPPCLIHVCPLSLSPLPTTTQKSPLPSLSPLSRPSTAVVILTNSFFLWTHEHQPWRIHPAKQRKRRRRGVREHKWRLAHAPEAGHGLPLYELGAVGEIGLWVLGRGGLDLGLVALLSGRKVAVGSGVQLLPAAPGCEGSRHLQCAGPPPLPPPLVLEIPILVLLLQVDLRGKQSCWSHTVPPFFPPGQSSTL